ncbi:hypothetical protein OCL44_00295 [Neisseria gonorrhoeae]|uniref:hypothetical protein n=1 Tax=Neisseria gonorrhoeae TaxID=485 RepID=UPI0021DA7B56|nr:hypothetical protein [Neisseria gonorrhoeae]UXY75803.1 hypothetical protein OCL44_00295 [Neisseria gonorrhoeae]
MKISRQAKKQCSWVFEAEHRCADKKYGFGLLNFWATWKIEDKGNITVRLGLPEVKAGSLHTTPPTPNLASPFACPDRPALWFRPMQNGKVQMYSASVSTYPAVRAAASSSKS